MKIAKFKKNKIRQNQGHRKVEIMKANKNYKSQRKGEQSVKSRNRQRR